MRIRIARVLFFMQERREKMNEREFLKQKKEIERELKDDDVEVTDDMVRELSYGMEVEVDAQDLHK